MSKSSTRGLPDRPRCSVFGASLITLVVVLQACAVAVRPGGDGAPGSASRADARAIRSDIAFLASDRLEGRGTGTPGNDSAAAYIARRFAALGLTPLAPEFEQQFVAQPLAAHNASPRSLRTQNVVGLLRGRDPALREQFIVI